MTGFSVAFIYAAEPLNSIITPLLVVKTKELSIPLYFGLFFVFLSYISGIAIIKILKKV